MCTSERCSPWALTGEKRPRPLTTVRSTSIGHAVFGTFCIALIRGSGSDRREPSSRLSVSSSMAVRQMAVKQKMNDFFERRVGREVVDVVATIGKTSDDAFDVTELGRPDDDAFETAIDNGRQGFPPNRPSADAEEAKVYRRARTPPLAASSPLDKWNLLQGRKGGAVGPRSLEGYGTP